MVAVTPLVGPVGPAALGRPTLELVVPARNEAARLPSMLSALREAAVVLAAHGERLAVVVVDNGSHDRTAAVAQEFDSVALPVRVVTCSTRGKGAAVRCGMAVTTAPYVGFLDADGATGCGVVAAALALLADGVDVVIGSRALSGSEVQVRHTAVREVGASTFRRLAAVIAPGVGDTQCGAKFFTGEVGRALFAALRTTGFTFDVEVLARAARHGLTVVEVAVAWRDVPGSTFVPARDGLRSFASLLAVAVRSCDGAPIGLGALAGRGAAVSAGAGPVTHAAGAVTHYAAPVAHATGAVGHPQLAPRSRARLGRSSKVRSPAGG